MTDLFGTLEVKKVSEVPPQLSILVYGEPGCGKTLFAASAHDVPEMRDVLFVDVEGGTQALRKDYGDVDVVSVRSLKELSKVGKALDTKEHGYKTIILDSLTEIQKLSMIEIMKEVVKEHPERDEDVPSQREWGINGNQTRKVVRDFRDLKDMNVIFTAHSQQVEKPGSNEVYQTKVSLTGKLSTEIAGLVNLILYLDVRTKTIKEDKKVRKIEKRYLITSTKGDIVAKDRSQLLPLEIEDPNMTMIYDRIYNGEV